MIGIVGGVGPLAGLNMAEKIVDEVKVRTDQEHLPFILSSQPHRIVDRTDFLLGRTAVNPGYAIAEIVIELERSGASVVAIPCNTAHSPRILDVVQQQLKSVNSSVKLLNLIVETVTFIKENYGLINVGVVSTTGTRSEGLYRKVLIQEGLTAIEPTDTMQEAIHAAIYDKAYGIKANSVIVSDRSRHVILSAIEALIDKGADAIILGCTELPIAIPETELRGVPLIDPNRIMARALVREMDVDKLTAF